MVFISYGKFGIFSSRLVLRANNLTAGIFFTLAASFQPFYNAAGAYSATGLNNAEGALNPAFNASFGTYLGINSHFSMLTDSSGMFLIACAVLNIFFLICATRINVVFFVIFLGASLGFILAASARWCIAEGHVALAERLVVVSHALLHLHPVSIRY